MREADPTAEPPLASIAGRCKASALDEPQHLAGQQSFGSRAADRVNDQPVDRSVGLELDQEGKLLADPGELLQMMGDIRSELFTYEVRATFDTPEIAEHRRIVAESQSETTEWQKTEWTPDEDDPDNK